MTPEEQFNQEIWWLLQTVKKELLLTPTRANVKINIIHLVEGEASSPAIRDIPKLISKLEEWRVWKIKTTYNPHSEGSYGDIINDTVDLDRATEFLLKINKPRFDELYKKYKKREKYEERKKDRVRSEIQKNVEDIIGALRKPKEARAEKAVNISYNTKTGVGYANKRFKFKNDQKEFSVFAEMYNKVNEPISRQRILELSGYKETGVEGLELLSNNPKRKPAIHTTATYLINELAKKMRKRTGLNKDQIVNNNGELTLVGTKTELLPPKNPK